MFKFCLIGYLTIKFLKIEFFDYNFNQNNIINKAANNCKEINKKLELLFDPPPPPVVGVVVVVGVVGAVYYPVATLKVLKWLVEHVTS